MDVTLCSSRKRISENIFTFCGIRNRAVDGDLVVVEILPENKWQSKSTSIHSSNAGTFLLHPLKTAGMLQTLQNMEMMYRVL